MKGNFANLRTGGIKVQRVRADSGQQVQYNQNHYERVQEIF